jgi:hypothetical protein
VRETVGPERGCRMADDELAFMRAIGDAPHDTNKSFV